MLSPLWDPIVFTAYIVVHYKMDKIGHYTVNKNSDKKCQHPREGNHIHGIEQDQPRGMKNRGQNNEVQQNLQENPTRQYHASVQ